MFGNDNSKTNGEEWFYQHIKNNIQVIFDVGCRYDSHFTTFNGSVHYFEPVSEFLNRLQSQPNNNTPAYFNAFGLGHENAQLDYYPKYQSFYDRVTSCKKSDKSNKQVLSIRKAKDYILEHNIESIDFLKIDTEGFEFNVLKGFEEQLSKVKIIQFEYGGTFLDNKVKLIEVIQYLESFGFQHFSYLKNGGVVPIQTFEDHYRYCNIVCVQPDKLNFNCF
jgi:FkbM family methyltransferase